MFEPSNQHPSRLGEVIETNSLGYWAESDRLHELPELGEVVRAQVSDDLTAYGVVSFGQTASIDPGRRAVRRGGADYSDAEVYDQHPELDHVLRTMFQVTSLGYVAQNAVVHALPPLPVPLHYSVRQVSKPDVERFIDNPDYLVGLIHPRGDLNPDDLLIAHLRWVDRTLEDENHSWLTLASRQIARLLKHDYDRLSILLAAIDPAPHGV